MICLDCETYETALHSVSKIMRIPREELRNHLTSTNYEALYEEHQFELPFEEFVLQTVCNKFHVSDFRIDLIYWFHLSRTMHPEWFSEKGILSLREMESLLHADIETLRQQMPNPPHYTCRGTTYRMLHDSSRQGPFAMLVKDVAFCHDEIGDHDYLSIPECVEDMGAGIAKLFYDNSKSVIVKFHAVPQFEAEAYLENVLCYLYCALNQKDLFVECNTCYEAPFHRILPDDIDYVKEVLENAQVSYYWRKYD
ncbi:MAG: hypothetical protein IJD38_03610 [Clostridia bacterium]|nr:hypothetical protein [Clostridia bacterium]